MSDFDLTDAPKELVDAIISKAQVEAELAQIELSKLKATNDWNRHLILAGPIFDTEVAIATLTRWARRDPGEPISILLNTPGGSVFDGNALLGCLKQLRNEGHHLTITGSGTVMSYGAILMQAANKRRMQDDCVFMLHGIEAPHIGGGVESIMDVTKMLAWVEENLLDAIAERATISKTKIKNMIKRKDLFLTAQEALKYGFIDEVV
jgi:ATP-dependent Clp protease protease subunit